MRYHRSGRKRLRHPVVGQLDLDFEALELPSEPGLQLDIYTAPVGSARCPVTCPGTTPVAGTIRTGGVAWVMA